MSKMTAEEVVAQLVKDENIFYGKEWTGVTPKNLSNVFKKIYKLLAPVFYENMIQKDIKEFRAKDSYQMGEINRVMTAFMTIPQIDVMTHANLTEEEYDEFMEGVNMCTLEWNILNSKFIKTMERKRERLEEFLPQKSKTRIISPHGN